MCVMFVQKEESMKLNCKPVLQTSIAASVLSCPCVTIYFLYTKQVLNYIGLLNYLGLGLEMVKRTI